MLTARFLRTRWHVLTILALVAALAAYTSRSGADASTIPPAPRYTAVQLVNGMLFADGPAASRLKVIHPSGIKHTAQLKKFKKLVDTAVAQDKAFSKSFRAQLQSGDDAKAQSALRKLGGKIKPIINKLVGQQKAHQLEAKAAAILRKEAPKDTSEDSLQYASYQVQIQLNVQIQTNTQAQVEVELELALALAVLVVLTVVVPAVNQPVSNSSKLASEAFVDSVAQHLRLA